jgi:Cytochrome P460
MIKAYRAGIPDNGKPFPEGSAIVKIEWSKKKNPVSPYFVEILDTLRSVSFIEKNSGRFPESSGWGYAQFLYDARSATFKSYGDDSHLGTKICYQCHTRVKERDYIFTDYPLRLWRGSRCHVESASRGSSPMAPVSSSAAEDGAGRSGLSAVPGERPGRGAPPSSQSTLPASNLSCPCIRQAAGIEHYLAKPASDRTRYRYS